MSKEHIRVIKMKFRMTALTCAIKPNLHGCFTVQSLFMFTALIETQTFPALTNIL